MKSALSSSAGRVPAIASPVRYSPAIVLRARPYGESDRIVTFLTRDAGKVSGIAKGALRSKRRFVGSLEPFTHVRLGYRQRAGKELGFVESSDIVRAPRNVGRDLDRYAYSTYLLDLVDAMVEGREAEASVFDLCESVLAWIDQGPVAPELLRFFETRLLTLCGFEPRLETCHACRRTVTEAAEPFLLDTDRGELRCADCGRGTLEGEGIQISGASVSALKRLRAASLAALPGLPPGTAGEVRVALQTFVGHRARRPLRSPTLLRDLIRRG